MEILQEDLFIKAETALRDGTTVIAKIGNCPKLAPRSAIAWSMESPG
ncbi:hypothetical protein [Pseudomonas sp. GXZC]|nr:hypothetical protein [Pseudomonas sp. GXZC]WAT32167.1 hypothetical protein OZ428_34470 [Pseudomonas sp. GXZC]